ncbi:hypothetical protein [Asaia sp. VD9]
MIAQQEIASGSEAFLRLGWADGHYEPYEFADIDKTLAAGLSLVSAR